MRKSMADLQRTVICSSVLIGLLGMGATANAHEIEVNRLPCNDLCQTWLGHSGHEDSTGSTNAKLKPTDKRSIRLGRPTASAPPLKKRRPEKEAAKVKRNRLSTEHPAPEASETAVAAKHARLRTREAQANVPLPIPHPVMPRVGPALAAGTHTPAAPKLSPSPHKLSEAAAIPVEGTRPPALINPVLPPVPDVPAAPESFKLQKELPATSPPIAAVAPSSPGTTSLSQVPTIGTAATHDDVTKPIADTKSGSSTPINASDRGRPDDQATPAYKPAVAQPSTVVASLPSPVNAGSSLRNDDHPSGSTQEGALQPVPDLAGTPLSVTVGQISEQQQGTDVHVVVVNVLQREMKDVEIRCRARDAQDLQVAEASVLIASIAPADVAFGQVLFPAEIMAKDNKFTCDVGKIAAANDVAP